VPKTLIAVLALSLAPLGSSHAQSAGGTTHATVPVTRVVLFSSGVGYFEHHGTVHGDGSTELRFKTDQINDVLKSLVLQDRDGGRVTTVTYPSQAPLSKTLRSFQVDITNNPSLADLLNQLRGARVTVQVATERVSGTILGVESRQKATTAGEPIVVPTLDLLTGATIRAVELPSVTSLSLDDPQLEAELTKALSALAQARDQDKKPVTIDFTGTGTRRVRVGYVVEAPVWKTSYRLLLNEKHSHLQGWAIVENQTESDWNDVSLSLVSGRPISFIMDLYQPLYATRQKVVPELFAGLRPQVYEQGLAGAMDSVALAPSEMRRDSMRRSVGAKVMQLNEVVVTAASDETAQSVQSIASTMSLGQLFEYSVGNVTLPRQKSAMLPIITDSIAVDRLSIYNASVLPRNALTGVRLKNITGKLLLQGPITVIDKNTYAGDARIDDVPAGQERLLSYGVDLQLVVDNSMGSQTNAVVTGKIVKGFLHLQTKNVASREYRAENKGDDEKTLIIEHPLRQGWKLVDTPTPVETTPTLYRFEGKAPAGKMTKLVVREELVTNESMMVMNMDMALLLTYSRTGALPADVRDALGRAMRLRQDIAEIEKQINDRAQRLGAITQEQARIREDMKTVAPTTSYYTRLLAKLNEQESTIERLQHERDELSTRRDRQRRELEEYLADLTIG
jgi:hypothetical protein